MALITQPMFSPSAVTKKGMAVQEQAKQNVNKFTREFAPSPVFTFANSVLTAGSTEIFDFFEDKPQMQKYGVFTNLVIHNNSNVTIEIYLNQAKDRVKVLPAGVIRELNKDDLGGGITSLSIKNIDSTTSATASQIRLEVFKAGTSSEDVFQSSFKRIFNTFMGGN